FSTSVPAATTPSASPATSYGDTREEFRKKFKNAIKINATKEMEKLLRNNLDETAIWVIELAHSQVIRPSDETADLFVQIEKTWQSAKRTEFPAEMRRFYEGLKGDEFKLYANLTRTYDKLVADYFAELNAEGGPKPTAMIDFADRFDSLCNDFEGLRCDFYASQCAAYAGVSWDKDRAKDLQDLKRACASYGRMIETRERMGLKDSILIQGKPRYQELMKLGYGPDGSGPADGEGEGEDEGSSGGGEAPAAAAAVEIPLEFELLESMEQFERPNYFVDEHYSIWHTLFLREVGSFTEGIHRLAPLIKRSGLPITARREGSAKFFVDMDGDEKMGEGDVEIPVKGKLEPVHFQFPVEGKTHHFAFFVQTGQEKDKYQGLDTNLQPSDRQVALYSSPAGSMVGTVGGETLRIIDEDLDGVYGGKIQSYGHVGLTEGHYQPEFDSMVVGNSKRAIPWSRYVKIDKQWYDLQSILDGTSLAAAPVTVATGELQLKFKGPKPNFVIVQGTDSMSEAFFDLAESSKVEVPTGTYKLLVGMIAQGKKQQVQKILMIPGSEEMSWTVGEGESVKVELGGPFKFDFG
ncbi:MAG: hypothetical protein KDB61_10260, partial [Planctomycetes bacterium]|nr:hypothetical protein [Planctomycetota bacterium]